jgi:hypothetical protein
LNGQDFRFFFAEGCYVAAERGKINKNIVISVPGAGSAAWVFYAGY